MPDYTNFRKVFGAIEGGASTGGKLPPIPEKPQIAGYLPAPPEARFISSAEEAAKKLAPTIKAESVKNELIKRGSNPVELEYSDVDGFMAANAGKKVTPEMVGKHLQGYGPLAAIGKVEQQPFDESIRHGVALSDARSAKSNGPFLSPTEATFDPQTAYPKAHWQEYTEQGKRGDYSGYREVLFEDPANRNWSPDGGMTQQLGQGNSIDAHAADYWLRYHNNPDSIAVQNMQSGVGQDWTTKNNAFKKAGSPDLPARIAALEKAGDIYRSHAGTDPETGMAYRDADTERELRRLESIGQAEQPPEVGPIAKNDNWKNFLARQVILEAAKEGKPISLPSADNATRVEHMPNDAARLFYERDMPERIRRIIKGFDPKEGARVEIVGPPQRNEPITLMFGQQIHPDDEASIVENAQHLSRDLRTSAGSYSHDNMKARGLVADLVGHIGGAYETGNNAPLNVTDMIQQLSQIGVTGKPELANKLQPLISQMHQAADRGKFYVPRERADESAARREGTWIHMSPVARREILEKGMPIMSVGAGALLGGLNDQSSDR